MDRSSWVSGCVGTEQAWLGAPDGQPASGKRRLTFGGGLWMGQLSGRWNFAVARQDRQFSLLGKGGTATGLNAAGRSHARIDAARTHARAIRCLRRVRPLHHRRRPGVRHQTAASKTGQQEECSRKSQYRHEARTPRDWTGLGPDTRRTGGAGGAIEQPPIRY